MTTNDRASRAVRSLGLAACLLGTVLSVPAQSAPHKRHGVTPHASHTPATTGARRTAVTARASRHTAGRSTRTGTRVVAHHRVHVSAERFYTSSFISTPQGEGDVTAGEDPVVRAAA
ncbi:MAG: hypothetical protein PW735_12070, partial [Acidobacteriaceae bacterium]|nr:hypothetical protein [Acidobacteriaceae bacterium]